MLTRKPETDDRGWFPSAFSLESAQALGRQGFWASIVCVIYSMIAFLDATLDWNFLLVPEQWPAIDVIVYGTLGYATFKMSRIAAVLSALLFVGERAYAFVDFSFTPFVALKIILFVLFINGVRGTFAYHRFIERRAARSAS